MDEAGDVTEAGCLLNEGVHRLARGHIYGHRAYLEPCIEQHLGGGLGVLFAQVCEHHLLAGAHSPGDGLTDRSGSDDDDDFTHDELLEAG